MRLKGSLTFEWNRMRDARSGFQDDTAGFPLGVEMSVKHKWFDMFDC